ncbi:MAG: hypothetical protein AB7O43_06235 [Hyphomicrobiaceae bacterium]
MELLLFLAIWAALAVIGLRFARRKGVRPSFVILGSFPLWVAFFALWLIKQPDRPDRGDGPRPF